LILTQREIIPRVYEKLAQASRPVPDRYLFYHKTTTNS